LDGIAPPGRDRRQQNGNDDRVDVLRHLREQHRQTAVILITAYETVETAVEGNEDGRVRLRDEAVQD